MRVSVRDADCDGRMRTTKRFSPTVLDRFERQGRGTGTHEEFVPWHQVSRGDPASSGRSHLLNWRGRLRHLLSDQELNHMLFASMLPALEDVGEQFALTAEPSSHPLVRWGVGNPATQFTGTEELARELGIRHPRVYGGGRAERWTLTTDLVVVLQREGAPLELLAIAVKPLGWHQRNRTVELLRLEREYWARRQVRWLLLTPNESVPAVCLTLRRAACWGLAECASPEARAAAMGITRKLIGLSLSDVLRAISDELGCMQAAQRALWQSVWSGQLPIDLRRGWRPSAPLALLSSDEFGQLNPIASRRSAWT